jgi:hypothetical protein
VLAFAVVRLAELAWDALQMPLSAPQWTLLVGNALLLAWAEGYRGFQRRFSPRAAARVRYLRDHATPFTALLAPVFCVGLVGATPRLLRATWMGTGLIVLAVLVVQRLEQPWRGILDLGVVIGLTWGLISFLLEVARALGSNDYAVDPQVDEIPAAGRPPP